MIVNNYKKNYKYIKEQAPFIVKPLWLMEPIMKKMLDQVKYSHYLKKVETIQERMIIKKETSEFIDVFYNQKKAPLFSAIEIETINRCNGECPFCPVNKHDEKRTFKKMDEALFKNLIDQLSELKYKGKLALHSNNEPFLDTRIIEFAKYAKEKLPKAFIYLYTNGTLVTMDKFFDIMQYLDKIFIDNYDDDLKLSVNSAAINDYCKHDRKMDKKVEIHLRKINEVLKTRGGQSPNNQKKEVLHMSCALPFKQVVVRPDGKMSLCCNDPMGRFTMGDLNKNTVCDIWNSEKYKKLRKSVAKGRKYISLCKYCDTMAGPKGY